MLLVVLDGIGISQTLIVAGQEAVVDRSGSIAATAVAQQLLAPNSMRSGFILQNLSSVNPLYINDLGAATTTGGSFAVPPGAFFPPQGYPVSTGALSVLGTAGSIYSAREW